MIAFFTGIQPDRPDLKRRRGEGDDETVPVDSKKRGASSNGDGAVKNRITDEERERILQMVDEEPEVKKTQKCQHSWKKGTEFGDLISRKFYFLRRQRKKCVLEQGICVSTVV